MLVFKKLERRAGSTSSSFGCQTIFERIDRSVLQLIVMMLSRFSALRGITRLERLSSNTFAVKPYSTSTLWNAAATPSDDDSKSLPQKDLVKIVAEAHDLSQVETRNIINTILTTITEVRRAMACEAWTRRGSILFCPHSLDTCASLLIFEVSCS